MISLGLICGGFISARASSVSSGDLFDVEEPILYYDGVSTFSLREDSTSQRGMLYLYQWDSANQVDVLAYDTSYSVGANLVTAAAYHTAYLWFYNQSFGEGEIAIDFTINIPNTTGYGATPITIDLISGDSVIESGSFSVGSHSVVFSGDYTSINNIRFKIATGVPAAQFDITINSIEFIEEEPAKNIFELLKDFCGSFFTKIKDSFKTSIVDSLKSLFIPEDGYFEDLFQRMQDFFSEKLGALYAPIDIFISILEGFSNASGSDPGIHFPGLKWEDTYIIEPQTVSLSAIAKDFPDLQEKIYFATNVIMVGSVLWLLQVKLREVLKN